MFLKLERHRSAYQRVSKLGKTHEYYRYKTVALFHCDNCGEQFSRDVKKVDRKRLSNNYFHCCSNCDAKRFAQRKGVEQKKIWDMPASLDWPINKF